MYIFILCILLWVIFLHIIKRKNIIKKNDFIEVDRILLTFKINNVCRLLDRLILNRFAYIWWFNFGLSVVFIGMVGITALFMYANISFFIELLNGGVDAIGGVQSIRNVLLIPGINQYIPIGYGLVALICSAAIHELGHAIAARTENMKITSVGAMFLIIPIAAFVEIDQTHLFSKTTKTIKRLRVLSAGAFFNLGLAFICIVLFLSLYGVLIPVGSVIVDNVQNGSLADNAGLTHGMIIVGINDMDVTGVVAFADTFMALDNKKVNTFRVYKDGIESIHIFQPNDGFIVDGDIKKSLSASGISAQAYPTMDFSDSINNIIKHPFSARSLFGLLFMPAIGLDGNGFVGFNEKIQLFYSTNGFPSIIFVVLDLLLWVAWMSFYIGLFNVLPAFPLDGGYIFRDIVKIILKKAGRSSEWVHYASNRILFTTSSLIFGSFAATILLPRIIEYGGTILL